MPLITLFKLTELKFFGNLGLKLLKLILLLSKLLLMLLLMLLLLLLLLLFLLLNPFKR